MTQIPYFDYAATAPVRAEVLESMLPYLTHEFGNAGSRTHDYGSRASGAVEDARRSIATVVSCDTSEVVFTSGATEANNIAILGLEHHGQQTRKTHIISTTIEHKAVLEPLEAMTNRGFHVELCEVGETGRVDPERLLGMVRPNTLMVSMMHANNETGVVQPVEEIVDGLRETDVFMHVDAAQTFAKRSDALRDERIDLISTSGHKIGGPKGVGALIGRRRNRKRPPLTPLHYGGGQERGLSPGTQAVHQYVGFGTAARLASTTETSNTATCRQIRERLLGMLTPMGAVTVGDQHHALPHILSVAIPGVDAEALMLACRDVVAISNGSACTSSSYQPSHVLTAMALNERLVSEVTRWSWGPTSSLPNPDELRYAIASVVP